MRDYCSITLLALLADTHRRRVGQADLPCSPPPANRPAPLSSDPPPPPDEGMFEGRLQNNPKTDPDGLRGPSHLLISLTRTPSWPAPPLDHSPGAFHVAAFPSGPLAELQNTALSSTTDSMDGMPLCLCAVGVWDSPLSSLMPLSLAVDPEPEPEPEPKPQPEPSNCDSPSLDLAEALLEEEVPEEGTSSDDASNLAMEDLLRKGTGNSLKGLIGVRPLNTVQYQGLWCVGGMGGGVWGGLSPGAPGPGREAVGAKPARGVVGLDTPPPRQLTCHWPPHDCLGHGGG